LGGIGANELWLEGKFNWKEDVDFKWQFNEWEFLFKKQVKCHCFSLGW
jgi:hypothetical protein